MHTIDIVIKQVDMCLILNNVIGSIILDLAAFHKPSIKTSRETENNLRMRENSHHSNTRLEGVQTHTKSGTEVADKEN
jgi:hypothetical protein